jgi:hypothetical protein
MNRRAFLDQLSRALAGVAVVATIPPVLASRLSWPYPLPDLREYGDGKRDATEAIQRHIYAAARDSGVVVLPEGTFRVRAWVSEQADYADSMDAPFSAGVGVAQKHDAMQAALRNLAALLPPEQP